MTRCIVASPHGETRVVARTARLQLEDGPVFVCVNEAYIKQGGGVVVVVPAVPHHPHHHHCLAGVA